MKGGFYLEIKDLPQLEEATESDHVVSSISQKTRLISFKNIFEKISFSSLVTTAKNIIGSINELKGRCDTLDTSVSKLNTDLKQGGIRFIIPNDVNTSTPNYADYSNALKIFWVNGWDANFKGLTPQPNASDYWLVLHIPCYLGVTNPSNDMSFIKQIWMPLSSNALYTRSYTLSAGWRDFEQK